MALSDDEKQTLNGLINDYYRVSGGKVPYFQFDLARRSCKPIPPKPETMVHLDVGSSEPTPKSSTFWDKFKPFFAPLMGLAIGLACYFLTCFIIALFI